MTPRPAQLPLAVPMHCELPAHYSSKATGTTGLCNLLPPPKQEAGLGRKDPLQRLSYCHYRFCNLLPPPKQEAGLGSTSYWPPLLRGPTVRQTERAAIPTLAQQLPPSRRRYPRRSPKCRSPCPPAGVPASAPATHRRGPAEARASASPGLLHWASQPLKLLQQPCPGPLPTPGKRPGTGAG